MSVLINAVCWLSGLRVAGWARLPLVKGNLVGQFLKENDIVRVVLGESLIFTCSSHDGAIFLFRICYCKSAGTST
jgi:hypothetical protein